MGSKQFTQKQKLKILKSAAEIGVRESAKIDGVHYTTVYDWRRQLDVMLVTVTLKNRDKLESMFFSGQRSF